MVTVVGRDQVTVSPYSAVSSSQISVINHLKSSDNWAIIYSVSFLHPGDATI